MESDLINKLFELSNKSSVLQSRVANENTDGSLQSELNFLSVFPKLCSSLSLWFSKGDEEAKNLYRSTMCFYGYLVKKAFSVETEISSLAEKLDYIESKLA